MLQVIITDHTRNSNNYNIDMDTTSSEKKNKIDDRATNSCFQFNAVDPELTNRNTSPGPGTYDYLIYFRNDLH